MGSTFNSVDNMLFEARRNGMWNKFFFLNSPGVTTSATTTSGGVTIQKHSQVTLPSVGSGLTGMRFPTIKMLSSTVDSTMLCGLEYELGSLTISGNSYTHGVSMPSKNVYGVTEQTAASMILVVVTTTTNAVTPTLTINYTNQSGVSGRTCTLTLPSSAAANSCFLVTPHLQSGDTGIRELSSSGPNGLSISTGTTGAIKLFGVLPLAYTLGQTACVASGPTPMGAPTQMWPGSAGETLGFYRVGSNQITFGFAHVVGLGEN